MKKGNFYYLIIILIILVSAGHVYASRTAKICSPNMHGGTLHLFKDESVLLLEHENACLFNPISEKWSKVNGPIIPVDGYSSLVLKDGRLMIFGGYLSHTTEPANAPQIFDPSTHKWTAMAPTRFKYLVYPAMVELATGKILIAAGINYSTLDCGEAVEQFDPITNSWEFLFSRESWKIAPRCHSQTLFRLPSNNILGIFSDASQIYNSTEKRFVNTHFPSGVGNNFITSQLSNGVVIAAYQKKIQAYDELTKTWATISTLLRSREDGKALSLPDGRVIIYGEEDGTEEHLNGDIFDPQTGNVQRLPTINLLNSKWFNTFDFVALPKHKKILIQIFDYWGQRETEIVSY